MRVGAQASSTPSGRGRGVGNEESGRRSLPWVGSRKLAMWAGVFPPAPRAHSQIPRCHLRCAAGLIGHGGDAFIEVRAQALRVQLRPRPAVRLMLAL